MSQTRYFCLNAERYRRRIESHVTYGRLDAAVATAALWCERSPLDLEPELTRARVELAAGHYRAAHDRAIAAIRTRDCPAALALEVVNCLRLFVAHNDMFDFASGFARWNEVTSADRARVAGALSAIGALPLARVLAEAAVADAPDDATARVNRALISSYAGDFAAARSDLEHTIATPQNPAMAHWLLARLDRQTQDSNHVQRLRRQLLAAGDDQRYKEYLHFSLFKELDDLQDIDAAWAALASGCALVRNRLSYDRAGRERLFGALKRQFSQAHQGDATTDAAPIPIFIVGMHRSGTTLLESMLATRPDVYAYGESQRLTGALRFAADYHCPTLVDERLVSLFPLIDPATVAARFLLEGRRMFGNARFVTEKMPGNFQLIGFIRHALPQAKVVHLRRDPTDLCFANLRELFADGVDYSYAQEDLAHFHALYADLMRHWQRVYPGFVLDVDYEALVLDPIGESRRVFEFCGLEWQPDVIEPSRWSARSINTLSSVQARGKASTSSIGRWKPYATWLEPLREALKDAHSATSPDDE